MEMIEGMEFLACRLTLLGGIDNRRETTMRHRRMQEMVSCGNPDMCSFEATDWSPTETGMRFHSKHEMVSLGDLEFYRFD